MEAPSQSTVRALDRLAAGVLLRVALVAVDVSQLAAVAVAVAVVVAVVVVVVAGVLLRRPSGVNLLLPRCV